MTKFDLVGGSLCLDFANTIHEYGAADPREELHSFEDLIAFENQAGVITEKEAATLSSQAVNNPSMAKKTLTSDKELRNFLHRSFSAIAQGKDPSSKDLAYFNQQLPGILQNLRIEKKGHHLVWGWRKDHGNFEGLLWPIMRSAVDLLTSEEHRFVRECES